ncbi:hypothetical protein U1Q18_044665 [Sarracenia purpurea var. burkii]
MPHHQPTLFGVTDGLGAIRRILCPVGRFSSPETRVLSAESTKASSHMAVLKMVRGAEGLSPTTTDWIDGGLGYIFGRCSGYIVDLFLFFAWCSASATSRNLSTSLAVGSNISRILLIRVMSRVRTHGGSGSRFKIKSSATCP